MLCFLSCILHQKIVNSYVSKTILILEENTKENFDDRVVSLNVAKRRLTPQIFAA